MVAVDYTDLLAVTLPYNVHHFEDVTIVTDAASEDAVKQVCWDMPNPAGTSLTILRTDLFTANGAAFNKWRALEWGLDQMGRHGWLCLMDADVLWPKGLEIRDQHETLKVWMPNTSTLYLDRGQLCTPMRRMYESLTFAPDGHLRIPAEEMWRNFIRHRNVREWAGYSQIFHASDPVLGPPPWHDVGYTHAGTADSIFQAKWPRERKVRPPFEVLHLGPAGQNWMGRATRRLDGSLPQESGERLRKVAAIWTGRRDLARQGKQGEDRYARERIPPSEPAPG